MVLFITICSFVTCAIVTVYNHAIGTCNLFQKCNLFHHIILIIINTTLFAIGQFHIREIKIENYEVEYIYSRVWVSGAHQFTGFRTVSYFKM